MNVRLEVLFEEITPEAETDLRAVGISLTDNRDSVRVIPVDGKPGWLAVEFSMPRQRQIDAVDRIDRSFAFEMLNRLDSVISFS